MSHCATHDSCLEANQVPGRVLLSAPDVVPYTGFFARPARPLYATGYILAIVLGKYTTCLEMEGSEGFADLSLFPAICELGLISQQVSFSRQRAGQCDRCLRDRSRTRHATRNCKGGPADVRSCAACSSKTVVTTRATTPVASSSTTLGAWDLT